VPQQRCLGVTDEPRKCLDQRRCEQRAARLWSAEPIGGNMGNTTSKCHSAVFVLCVLLCVCCDEDGRDDYFNYLASSYVDTVLAGDTVATGEEVSVIHKYPYGCNSFERLDCVANSDTLLIDAIYRFKYEGKPCAHGSGLDTTQYVLCFHRTGSYVMEYQRDDTTTVHQSVVAQ
jgi:hypothetical protein